MTSQDERHDHCWVAAKKVLIFRIGSIGDTIVALPAFHLIARAFPNAERRVLTNLPVSRGTKEAPLPSVLEGSTLVHSYISYPVGLREKGAFTKLWRELKTWKPDVMVYLMPSRTLPQLLRDRIFFELCSIRNIVGLKFAPAGNSNPWLADENVFEPEARRLIRNLSDIGAIDINDPASWDLGLTNEEIADGIAQIAQWEGKDRFIACSIGTKQDVNYWGNDRWIGLIQRLAEAHTELGLLFIGASDEYQRSEQLSALWKGPRLNLCGKLAPRLSAVVLRQAILFVGHDSGPMHLAAAVGTKCIGIFSARNKPGIWFPFGKSNKIIYPAAECGGCQLQVCEKFQKKCIRSISGDEVFQAVVKNVEVKGHERLYAGSP
jgi:heptosyltransferase-3